MKNKKGFTLIELLAVIVILAIIALIAVPVIMNILDKANKSAFKDTAYGILSAGELYFAEQQLELNGMSGDKTFDLSDENNGLQIKGDVPDNGTLVVNEKGQTAIAVTNGRYCITKWFTDNDIEITEEYTDCKILYPTLSQLATTETGINIPECITNKTKCTGENLVAVEVNDREVYNFYIIADDNSEVTLMMDRNLGNTVAWVSKVDYNDNINYGDYGNNNKGPITALNYLNNQTKNWINIPGINDYTFDNNLNGNTKEYGYQKLVVTNGTGVLTSQDGTINTTLEGTMRARILTKEEVVTLKTANSDTTPTWLYGKLSSTNTTAEPVGYWLLTANASDSRCGDFMYYTGYSYGAASNNDTDLGLRPVIELSK